MKYNSDEQFIKHLSVFSNIKEIGAPDFFYSRLISKMEKHNAEFYKKSKVKTIWIVSSLALLLIVNTILLKFQSNSEIKDLNSNIESLASAYDQIIFN